MEDTRSYQVGGTHYLQASLQPWDAMEQWMSSEEFVGYLKGNAIKYLYRAGRKGSEVVDIQKAQHYLTKLVSVLEAQDATQYDERYRGSYGGNDDD